MFDTIQSDKKTKELIRLREKGERDFNLAMKYSRMEGIKAVTLSMLADGMSISTISKYTGLSISEIEALNIK